MIWNELESVVCVCGVCVCVCVRARACVCAGVCMWVVPSLGGRH